MHRRYVVSSIDQFWIEYCHSGYVAIIHHLEICADKIIGKTLRLPEIECKRTHFDDEIAMPIAESGAEWVVDAVGCCPIENDWMKVRLSR